MKDLKLDKDTHDLKVENFDLSLITGIDRVVQDLKVRLWVFLNEWFLDTSIGLPFYSDINVKNPDLNAIEAIFKEKIIETEDVNEILEFQLNYNSSLRTMSVSFSVNTTFGSTGQITQEFS